VLTPIENTPRDYAWGSTTAIPELLGHAPSGRPEAELWLGTHPGSPAHVVESGQSLADIARLPFLLKLLAAGSPLSLQAHPTPEQARAGFERETEAGVPLDSPTRNYKDPFHKPELVYALSERFEALCGFQPVPKTKENLALLGPAAEKLLVRLGGEEDLPSILAWLLERGDGVDELIADVVAACAGRHEPAFATVTSLADAFPGDPGILISLLLNRVTLAQGEVLYLPAGNIHAYLEGLGVELMAASDNVLRGGLTPKHVDVSELLSVLDFRALPVPYLAPTNLATGVEVFTPDVPDFQLLHAVTDADIPLPSAAIALCTEGSFTVNGLALARGEALYIVDEASLAVVGDGDLFIATASVSVV
jgi:mannose-6-phosphate isomerase